MQTYKIRSKPTRLMLALSVAYAGAYLASPGIVFAAEAAAAAEKVVVYSLDKGPLDQSLLAIARLSGRSISFDPALLKSYTSAPVQGSLSVEQAIAAALKGSDFVLAVTANGTLTIAKTKPAAADVKAPEASVATLKAITVVAERDQAETSFKADRSSTSTRSGTDLMDVPAAVTIITAKAIESQQAATVEDVLAKVAGVIYTSSPQSTSSFSIRGFSNTSVLNNGLSDPYSSATNVSGIERVEVLKGPQAILSGQGSLGGGVNIVLKKPQAETLRELTVQYSTEGEKTLAGDLSGALTDDKKLSYRLIASGTKSSTNYADYDGRKDQYLLPELRWKDNDTDLIVGMASQNQHAPMTAYTFAANGHILQQPNMMLGVRDDGIDTQTTKYFYSLEQKLSPDVKLVSRLQRSEDTVTMRTHSPQALIGQSVAYSGGLHTETAYETVAGDHYLDIAFATGPVKHKLTTGLNHDEVKYGMLSYDSGSSVLVPVYGSTPYAFSRPEGTAYSMYRSQSSQQGLYAMDLMSYGDFNLLLGLRRGQYSTASNNTRLSSGRFSDYPVKSAWNTSPMAGLVYNLTPSVSAYTSYSQGFVPQYLSVCNGGQNQPLATRNKEAGMKFDLLDSKLSITTAYFNLSEQNVPSYSAAGSCYNLIPAQKTKGFELDIQGELAKGLNLVFNAAYSEIKDSSGEILRFGARPAKKASLWATYDFQSKALHGWGTGLGVTAQDTTWGTYVYAGSTGTFKVPGSANVDASVYYSAPKWSVTLGVKNALDREQYGFATTSSYVPVKAGRSATLTYRVKL